MPLVFGGQGVTPSTRGQPTSVFTLKPSEVRLIPAGAWNIGVDRYSAIQEYDPVTTIWRNIGNDNFAQRFVQSDGVNFRIANQTGCCVGAMVTTAGSGYTSAPTVTANGTGAPVFQAIVGGAINTSVTVTNGGTNYTYPPLVLFDAPPSPGVQATGYATISGGAVTSVTITDQGAGYTNIPNISLVNDPRDTTGDNAAAVCVLTGSGTITAIVVTDHGNAVTSVPTLTISGGGGSSGAATAIMCFTATAYTVTSAGSGYVGNVLVTGLGGGPVAASASYTNPAIQSNLVRQRPAFIAGVLSATALSATGQTVYDGGIFPGVPDGYVAGFATGSAALASFAVGGANSTVVMLPA